MPIFKATKLFGTFFLIGGKLMNTQCEEVEKFHFGAIIANALS
jgi:hypothetical protein